MIRRGYLIVTLLAVALLALQFPAAGLIRPRPRLIWNASASAPIGLYRVEAISYPAVGALVAIMPPKNLARFLDQRHYLPVGVPLLKHIAARPGARVCRFSASITIDGRVVAIALDSDSRGRPLPRWRGCHFIEPGKLFLLNPAADSMDGRYFGPIPANGLIGSATPILTRDAPDMPLHWRGLGIANAPPTSKKGQHLCK